jgi:hypothetical protein
LSFHGIQDSQQCEWQLCYRKRVRQVVDEKSEDHAIH